MNQILGINPEHIIRIILACVAGLLIGYERESRNKFAGVRTHIIVSLGACIGMLVSKYGFDDCISNDPSRIASQIVSGIGFLGAGVIFAKNSSISGLTTAAGIWTTSIIGLTFGAGLYTYAVLGTIIIVLVEVLLYRNDFFKFNFKLYTVMVECKTIESVNQFKNYLEENSIRYKGLNTSYDGTSFRIDFKYLSRNEAQARSVIEYLDLLEGVIKFRFF